jgi:short-subunit dehydrogenase
MRKKLKPLSRQTIVITGASSGNGLAIAERAVAKGAAVVLVARNREALQSIAERFRGEGGRVAIAVVDVAREGAAEEIAETAIHAFGGFDTWVNNAAAAAYGTMEELSIEEHRRIFDVNYFGTLTGSLVAARHLKATGGAIINIGSVLSEGTILLQGPYSASKHAIKAATEALRMELDRERAPVSVTLIQASAMHTPYPEHARSYLDQPPRLPPVLYDPRLIAEAVLFAAEHPRRSMRVGSAGQLIGIGHAIAPQLSEWLLTHLGRRLQVTSGQDAGDPEMRDNLQAYRKDGEIDGNQQLFTRKRSYLLMAQMHPGAALVLGAAATLFGGSIWSKVRARRK